MSFILRPDRFGVSPAGYAANAVQFTGGEWAERDADLTGNADGTVGSCSFWMKVPSDVTTNMGFFVSGSSREFELHTRSDGRLELVLRDASNSIHINLRTANDIFAADDWVNYKLSWDVSSETYQVYTGDTSNVSSVAGAATGDIDYTQTDHAIGARIAGGSPAVADIADFWLTFSERIDFSVEANRRRFLDGAGKPVDLGSDGSDGSPSSTQPIVFFSDDVGDGSGFFSNKGSGGGFTSKGTALGSASTSPSD